MESIRIKNFRSLKDTGSIDIKPITILVGKNSAGKSTFLRTFPLFKQSVEGRTKAPILLYSRNGVDFGSYKDVKSIFSSSEDNLEFEFLIKNMTFQRQNHRSWYFEEREKANSDLIICMKIGSDTDDTPILKTLELTIFKNKIEIHFDNKENIVTKFVINNEAIKLEQKVSYISSGSNGLMVDRFILNDAINRYDLEDYAEDKLKKIISNKLRKGTSDDNISAILRRSCILNSKEKSLKQLKSIKKPTTWTKKTEQLTIDSPYFKEFYELTLLKHLEEILQTANIQLRETFHRVKYIAPIRATAERYYRIQDLSVDEVDPHGQNLPMFLGSLSPTMMKKFQLWTEENFDFKVKIKRIEGHYSIKILYKNNFEVNISDMGFGYSQILPIITQLWYSTEQRGRHLHPRLRSVPTIFVIEQPELHLHPEFQAKFADVIVKVINDIKEKNVNIKLIIETHSQTIINRLGLNISKNIISKDTVNIIIFNKLNEGEATTITSAKFDDDGLLENWPIGFFKPKSLENI